MKSPEEIYKVLGDYTRLRMLSLLYRMDLCVCQFSWILDESQAKVSRHLARLREADLVNTRRENQFIYYSLNRDESFLVETLTVLHAHLDQWEDLGKDQEKAAGKNQVLEGCRSANY